MKADSKNNSTEKLNNPGEGASGSKDPEMTVNDGVAELDATEEKVTTKEHTPAPKLDLDKKLTSHLDKLDSLIHKAERAEVSLQKQNKQIKGMLP